MKTEGETGEGAARLSGRRQGGLGRFLAGFLAPVPLLLASACYGADAFSVTTELQTAARGEKILPVRNIQQLPEYPSGCEITAAAIALNYLGCPVGKTELGRYFPIGGRPRPAGGKLVGPDPWTVFAGDPKDSGYGCFAPVVTQAVNRCLSASGSVLRAENRSGMKTADLIALIDRGVPVVVWATIAMQAPYFGDAWYLNGTGEYFRWPAREHCLVLIGYSGGQAVFSDPLDRRGTVRYDFSLFETRYRQLLCQAVVIG